MIGQNKNKELLMQWRMNRSVPRFIILEGNACSGRLTFAKEIISVLNAQAMISGNAISDVREVIDNSYNVSSTMVYIFRDCDDMSVAAKNSLLKVVEEPPNKAYFIMTINSSGNMLDTILSRATLIKMQPYSRQELIDCGVDSDVLDYVRSPGENYRKEQILSAKKLSESIIESLNLKKGVNILRDTCLLKNKDTDEDKVECDLFFRVFEQDLIKENFCNYKILDYISECKRTMNKNSVNKKACIEVMLIKIIEELKSQKICPRPGEQCNEFYCGANSEMKCNS